MERKNDIYLIVIAFLTPLILFLAVVFWQHMNNYSSAAKANLSENTVVKSLADSINLQVPFITQAPFMLWKTYPFETTCEETCALMMHYYLSGIKTVDENITKQEILSIVDFENKTYGFSDDTNAAETARFIRDYYKYNAQVYYNISIDDIKRELNEGNPVIVPTAGRLLFNPDFTPPGPIYIGCSLARLVLVGTLPDGNFGAR